DALDRFGGPELAAALADYRRGDHPPPAGPGGAAGAAPAGPGGAGGAGGPRVGPGAGGGAPPRGGGGAGPPGRGGEAGGGAPRQAAATIAHEALIGDPASASVDASDAVTLLGIAVRALEPVRSHDPALAGLADRLSEASYLISDVAGELASYTESLDSDPAR